MVPLAQKLGGDTTVNNLDILFELGFSLGVNSQYGSGWRKATVDELPPQLRDWALDHLVHEMQVTGQPCGVWKVRIRE